MPKPLTHRILDVYGDDSSTSDRFVLYGVLACETNDTAELVAELRKCGGPSEFKWNNLSPYEYDAYVRFVDVLFDWIDRRKLVFRVIVVDTSKANYKEYSNGSRTLALEKFAFLILDTFSEDHKTRPCSIFARLDEGDVNHSREFMKLCLNRRDRRKHERDRDLFELVVDVKSKDYLLVQGADVIAGAIGYITNRRHLDGEAAGHRLNLATHIAKRANIRVPPATIQRLGVKPGDVATLALDIPRHIGRVRCFGIWHLDWEKEHENDLRALSRDQLAHFPRTSTFADIRAKGYRVDMVCSRCNRKPSEDILRFRPEFGDQRLDDPRRPPCGSKRGGKQCTGRGVVLVHPDPLLPMFSPS